MPPNLKHIPISNTYHNTINRITSRKGISPTLNRNTKKSPNRFRVLLANPNSTKTFRSSTKQNEKQLKRQSKRQSQKIFKIGQPSNNPNWRKPSLKLRRNDPYYSFREIDYNIHTHKDHHIVFSLNEDITDLKLKKKYKPYYYVSPIELNTVLLQYLVDNNLLTYDEKGLGFKDFPSLVVEQHNQPKFTKEDSHFVEVCEKEYNPERDLCNPFHRDIHYQNLYGINPLLPSEKRIYDSEFRTPGYINKKDEIEIYDEPVVLVNDVFYVTQLIRKLRDFERKKVRNDGLKVAKDKEGTRIEKDECDLKFSEYDIIEEMGFIEGVGDVVIVGYPDTDDMGHFLNNEDFMKYFKETYKIHENYDKLLVGLYNAFQKDERLKIEDFLGLLKLTEPVDKIGTTAFLESIYYIRALLKNELNDINESKFRDFILEVDKKLREKYQGFFNYPNIRISYVFHHFIKTEIDGIIDFEPMIYSIRELSNKHKPVLSRTLDLIEIELPKKFQLELNKEGRFEHFYSYHRYGDIFYIRTDNDNDLYSNVYQRSITLEELIYSCSVKASKNFWKNLKFEYKLKNNRVIDSKGKVKTKLSLPPSLSLKIAKKPSVVSRPPVVFTSFLQNVKIIRCNLLPTKEVEIYYLIKIDGVDKFFYIKLKPNLQDIDILKILDKFKEAQNLPIYKCGFKKVKTVSLEYSLYIVLIGPLEINGNTDENFNLFKRTFYSFPTIKQPVPNYIFLDQLIGNTDNKYSDFFTYGIFNAFFSRKISKHIKNKGEIKESDKCDDMICTPDEYNTIDTFKKIAIFIDGIIYYVLVIHKVPFKNLFRYVVWVYQTNKYQKKKISDIVIEFNNNKIRSIFDLKGEHLQIIIDALKADRELFPDIENNNVNYPTLNNNYIILNKTTGATTEVLHIQILPKTKTEHNIRNLSYENREENISNILHKLKIQPKYYNNMKNNKNMSLFSTLSLSSL